MYLRGIPEKKPTPLEMTREEVNINLGILISTPDERPPLLKEQILGAKWVTS